MSSSASVRSGWALVVVLGTRHVSLWALCWVSICELESTVLGPYLRVLQSYWKFLAFA